MSSIACLAFARVLKDPHSVALFRKVLSCLLYTCISQLISNGSWACIVRHVSKDSIATKPKRGILDKYFFLMSVILQYYKIRITSEYKITTRLCGWEGGSI